MEIIAHGLWTAAAATMANRSARFRLNTGWTVWWGCFPDLLAFGPGAVAGVWLRLTEGQASDHLLPHVHIGLPLYPAGHSLMVFLLAFGLVSLLARRVMFEMLGWLLHILIDIPTHSMRYYATRFLWPISDFRIDGIAWWTPWFWAATYGALFVVYVLMWRRGLFARNRNSEDAVRAG
jgi:hypothetical protein